MGGGKSGWTKEEEEEEGGGRRTDYDGVAAAEDINSGTIRERDKGLGEKGAGEEGEKVFSSWMGTLARRVDVFSE